jgi:hypothetical protein
MILSAAGVPNNTNIQLPTNITIKKDEAASLLRVFANNNATVGAYTLYFNAQGQVSYARNPEAAERATKEKAEAEAALKAAQDALNKAKAAQTEATKKQQESQQAAQKAKTDLDNATKQEAANVAKAKQTFDQAVAAQQAAEKAKATADAAATTAADEAAKKAAEAAQADAAKKLTEAQTAAQTAKTALDAATKQEQTKVAEAKAAADKAAEAAKVAEKAKADADAAAKTADDEAKKRTTLKQQTDQYATNIINAAKPKNINLTNPSTPVIIRVKEAPAQLAASVPGGGNVKKGQKLEIKVTVKRLGDFAGPVALSLPLPPNVKGLTAAAVTVPADQTEGVLVVQAAGDATEGKLENMVVRGTLDHHGQAAVDVPVTINVTK